ncbi:uncharacterized protein [Spinacia oleracea]|uniref:Reverse transcriptase zinc-binding domain-containing protein n=1 Tax=Spinacia oleracea TaxID=3562 RepID=A0A9R0JR64_SPIOL|nr:uncharacterized protein LOC110783530 [Spinacia oleracea]
MDLTHMMFADDLLLFARGDSDSVTFIFSAFSKLSAASGLQAYLHKSEVYIAGVPTDVVDQIVESLGIIKGSFPVKYLGVPLTTRKLSYTECKPLIEKTVARIKSWSARLLSYAGRLQLIKSVLFGIQLYWCQTFVLQKKVMKEVHRICRSFLWTGSEVGSRKGPVSWEQWCLPKSNGRWNLKDLTIWNKAAVMKHCWALSMKQDRLWNRLATKDRLISWNLPIQRSCGLCQVHDETLCHLFFECSYANEIWTAVLQELGIVRGCLSWQEELRWVAKKSRSTRLSNIKCSVAFIETVYAV